MQAFYSTRHDASAIDIITWYAQRWSIEEAFRNSNGHLGFDEPRGRTRRAVERTAPTAMLLYSLIVVWYARVGHRLCRPLNRPWYRSKARPSFIDMLITLREESVCEKVAEIPLTAGVAEKS